MERIGLISAITLIICFFIIDSALQGLISERLAKQNKPMVNRMKKRRPHQMRDISS